MTMEPSRTRHRQRIRRSLRAAGADLPAAEGGAGRAAEQFGAAEALLKGTMFARGDPATDLFIVIEGSIEICEEGPTGPVVIVTHTEREFTGDLDLLLTTAACW